MPLTRIRHAIAAAGLFGAVASAAPLAVDFSGASYFLSGTQNNIGWSFSVTSRVSIDGLGLFDYGADGLANRHQVGLWDSANNLIAQATVFNGATALPSAASTGQWLFADIAAMSLDVGDYVIGAFYADDDADAVAAIASGLALDSHFSFGASRASDATSFGEPGVYGIVEPGVFGPNLRVATELPEPSMLAVLAVAMVAGAVARRRPS